MMGSGTSTPPSDWERSLLGQSHRSEESHRLDWSWACIGVKSADLDNCTEVMEMNVLDLRNYPVKYLGVKERNVCNRFQMVQKKSYTYVYVYVHTHVYSAGTHCLCEQTWQNVNTIGDSG